MFETIKLMDTLFEIRRNPRRRQLSVGITSENKYYIATPQNISKEELVNLLKDKLPSIVASLKEKTKERTNYSYNDGEMFFLKGKTYPLVFDSTSTHSYIKFNGTSFILSAINKKEIFSLFENFYARKLKEDLMELLPKWAKQIGVSPNKIHIKNVKTMWGSCSSNKNLTFSTRLALVPQEQLEYVIVHELCHIKEMNHSSLFWDEVSKYIPNHKEERNLLKQNTHKYKWW